MTIYTLTRRFRYPMSLFKNLKWISYLPRIIKFVRNQNLDHLSIFNEFVHIQAQKRLTELCLNALCINSWSVTFLCDKMAEYNTIGARACALRVPAAAAPPAAPLAGCVALGPRPSPVPLTSWTWRSRGCHTPKIQHTVFFIVLSLPCHRIWP